MKRRQTTPLEQTAGGLCLLGMAVFGLIAGPILFLAGLAYEQIKKIRVHEGNQAQARGDGRGPL